MTARVAVGPWAPEYGTPVGMQELDPSPASIAVEVEMGAPAWRPLAPDAGTAAGQVLFVDGVRRVDAWLWISDDGDTTKPGMAASYAAGVVRCDGAAHVERVEVRRVALSPAAGSIRPLRTCQIEYLPQAVDGHDAEALMSALQQRMRALEALVASQAGAADLVVADGPLSNVPALAGAIGYVKTHHTSYLPGELAPVVAGLGPGQRTPLFLVTTAWSRYCWYARLADGADHPWAGVVRCEVSGDRSPAEAAGLADLATATLPRFASQAHKDPRAPQNLYPIAGLERDLRRRLGDQHLLYRSLRLAAASGASL